MLGVEADPEAITFFRRIDHVPNLLEAVAEIASLTGGNLQRDSDIIAGAGGVDIIQRTGDGFYPFLFTRARMGPRMGDQVRDG